MLDEGVDDDTLVDDGVDDVAYVIRCSGSKGVDDDAYDCHYDKHGHGECL